MIFFLKNIKNLIQLLVNIHKYAKKNATDASDFQWINVNYTQFYLEINSGKDALKYMVQMCQGTLKMMQNN